MIYRFIQAIRLPDGVTLPKGDAVILDDPDSNDPVAEACRQAEKDGLRDMGDFVPPKKKKNTTEK